MSAVAVKLCEKGMGAEAEVCYCLCFKLIPYHLVVLVSLSRCGYLASLKHSFNFVFCRFVRRRRVMCGRGRLAVACVACAVWP